MKNWQSHRPPKRRCPSCGGDHYAFGEGTACRSCMTDTAADGAALRELAREAREARRAAWEAPQGG